MDKSPESEPGSQTCPDLARIFGIYRASAWAQKVLNSVLKKILEIWLMTKEDFGIQLSS